MILGNVVASTVRPLPVILALTVLIGVPVCALDLGNSHRELSDDEHMLERRNAPIDASVAQVISPPFDGRIRSNQSNGQLGRSIASAGDVNGDGYDDIIVGMTSFINGDGTLGAAFVFHGGPAGVPSAALPAADSVLRGDQVSAFGFSVAGAGDVNADGFDDVIVGDPGYDHGEPKKGAAFVFLGGPSGILDGSPDSASAIIESNQAHVQGFGGGGLGIVAGAGDVNGDGFDDIVVSSEDYFTPFTPTPKEGIALVFHGGATGIVSGNIATADSVIESDVKEFRLGASLDSAGDVNGDGYSDIIIGVRKYSSSGGTGSTQGAAIICHGGSAGIASGNLSNVSTLVYSTSFSAFMGASVAGAGDLNCDGYDDVVIGAPQTDISAPGGYVYIYYGSQTGIASGTSLDADATLQSDQNEALFGCSVSGGGDWNGDGYADVIVGAYKYAPGYPDDIDDGSAFVFLGGPAGLTSTTAAAADARLFWNQSQNFQAFFGTSVAFAGDTNDDGYAEILVGSPGYDGLVTQEGAVYEYFGGASRDVTAGVYSPSTGAFFLRNSNTAGAADLVLNYGPAGAGLVPLVGDWDGNGTDTVGLYNPASGAFFLKNLNQPGPADLVFGYGPVGLGWIPLVGDWDGDGYDTVGFYDPAGSFFFLKNTNASGSADLVYGFGPAAGWTPLAGDFDGNGTGTVALYDPSTGTFFARNVHAAGPADVFYSFGPAGMGWVPLCGDFNSDGVDTFGLYAPATGSFFLRNLHAPGAANLVFGYGPPGLVPLVGNWDGQ